MNFLSDKMFKRSNSSHYHRIASIYRTPYLMVHTVKWNSVPQETLQAIPGKKVKIQVSKCKVPPRFNKHTIWKYKIKNTANSAQNNQY